MSLASAIDASDHRQQLYKKLLKLRDIADKILGNNLHSHSSQFCSIFVLRKKSFDLKIRKRDHPPPHPIMKQHKLRRDNNNRHNKLGELMKYSRKTKQKDNCLFNFYGER
jgi:hypothetical protein